MEKKKKKGKIMAFSPDFERSQFLRDIFFAKKEYKLVDDYVIRDGKTHPCAIVVPGGGYQSVCSFIEGIPFAKRLNALGISVFIVYYRVGKNAAFPNPQDDLARAVKEILKRKDEYKVDMNNYSVWGSSAGGHLVASFGTKSMGYEKYGLPKPGTLVLVYPVISMDKSITHMGSRENLLGKNPPESLVNDTSIELQVTPSYPRTFIWCGTADTVVDPENTRRMAAALEEAGVPYQCEIYPEVGHGVGPATGTNAEGWINKAVDYWLGTK